MQPNTQKRNCGCQFSMLQSHCSWSKQICFSWLPKLVGKNNLISKRLHYLQFPQLQSTDPWQCLTGWRSLSTCNWGHSQKMSQEIVCCTSWKCILHAMTSWLKNMTRPTFKFLSAPCWLGLFQMLCNNQLQSPTNKFAMWMSQLDMVWQQSNEHFEPMKKQGNFENLKRKLIPDTSAMCLLNENEMQHKEQSKNTTSDACMWHMNLLQCTRHRWKLNPLRTLFVAGTLALSCELFQMTTLIMSQLLAFLMKRIPIVTVFAFMNHLKIASLHCGCDVLLSNFWQISIGQPHHSQAWQHCWKTLLLSFGLPEIVRTWCKFVQPSFSNLEPLFSHECSDDQVPWNPQCALQFSKHCQPP